MPNPTTSERTSERELVVTRTFNAPVDLVYAAWTQPDLFRRWWVPASCGLSLASCEMDVRVGGGYRLVYRIDDTNTMAFFGSYTDVIANARITWTNDEGGDGGSVTTVTFEERGDTTVVVMRDVYPSKQALDDAIESGSTSSTTETCAQLDDLLATLPSSSCRA